MRGLEKIIEKIISDSQARADEIISEAEKRCAEIESECERKKAQIESEAEADAVKEEESIKMRARSGIAKNHRDNMLALRADMTDKAFDSAVDAIVHLPGDEYRDMFSRLMAKALCDRVQSERDSMRLYGEDISPEKYEIIMNKKDREAHGKAIMEGARRATVGKLPADVVGKMVLSSKTANIEGGFIIKCGDIELNCSARTLIEGVRPQIEARVAEVLFADTENKN